MKEFWHSLLDFKDKLKLSEEMKTGICIIFFIYFLYSFISFIVGANHVENRYGKTPGCVLDSRYERIDLGYRLGCYMFKKIEAPKEPIRLSANGIPVFEDVNKFCSKIGKHDHDLYSEYPYRHDTISFDECKHFIYYMEKNL